MTVIAVYNFLVIYSSVLNKDGCMQVFIEDLWDKMKFEGGEGEVEGFIKVGPSTKEVG